MPRILMLLVAAGLLAGGGPARAADRDARVAAGEENAKRLLALMDEDKDGNVSKAEFMKFMEQEFDRLDVNKDGKLDVGELTKFHVRAGIGNHR